MKVADLLGVKYVLDRVENASTQKEFPQERFSLIYEKDGWKIFENKKALPRVFLVSKYKVAKTSREFEKIFFAKDFNPLKTIILEEELIENFDDSNHRSSLELVSYTPNKIKIKTNVDGSRLLFLSDTYYPGWKVYVDGKETKIYRANYAFRAVVVNAGKHDVKFIYEPTSFKLGYIVSFVSLVFAGVWLLTIKKNKHNI